MITFFQVFVSLSLLTMMVVVYRLLLAIRMLNARVNIQSSLIKNIRHELEKGMEDYSSEFAQMMDSYSAADNELHGQLKRDFSYQDKKHHELLSSYVVEGKNSRDNLDVAVNTDLSYIGTGSQKEAIKTTIPASK